MAQLHVIVKTVSLSGISITLNNTPPQKVLDEFTTYALSSS
jgi:hypothetical protein